jgi:hypothetical protein
MRDGLFSLISLFPRFLLSSQFLVPSSHVFLFHPPCSQQGPLCYTSVGKRLPIYPHFLPPLASGMGPRQKNPGLQEALLLLPA